MYLRRRIAFIVTSLGFLATTLQAQESAPMLPRQQAAAASSPESFAVSNSQNPFFGSVTQGKPNSEVLELSLASAVERGLKNNLGALLARHYQESAEGQRWLSRSGLLPNVTTRTAETLQQINLAAFGFPPLPSIPSQIIGPFAIFDARIAASQAVFDWGAIASARAGSESLKAAGLSYDNARDVVVMVATSLYLQAAAGQSRIEAAEARVKSAQALYDQVVDMKQAGIVPAIEVLRAQVELQATQQQLIYYRNEFEKQKLNLARTIGVPEAQSLRLTDRVPYAPLPALTQDTALKRAFDSRPDYKSAASLVKTAELQKTTIQAERLPTVSANADFGTLGRRISSSHETFSATASLHIPIFQAGRVKGEVLEAEALIEKRKAELDDLRGRIEH
jgi:outer membrane protein TolC